MSEPQLSLSQLALPLILSVLLAACQPGDVGDGSVAVQDTTAMRKAADALDKATADARKARVSAVEYDLDVDLDPAAPHFGGEVTIRFDLAGAEANSDSGPNAVADLTLDFGGGTVLDVNLNGGPVESHYNGSFLTLPAASLRSGSNTVTIRFDHPYSEDGTGLHRFVDPADGRHYLYTYLWPYYANRLFPAFDQPNLKAKITLSVRVPDEWIVVSMASGNPEPPHGDGTTTWRFDATPEMATYAFSLHAGPYQVWRADADGIPLRLLARQSLAPFVAVDEWFEVTRRGLQYYGEYFAIPYPFTKYDQLIVPDFNIGAMENIAAVTFSEEFVQRQPSDRAQREDRASVILHEMAHMWFGNLVTHDWWNGLWLNESFATQMAAMAELETTEFSDSWHGFFTEAKQLAYRADSRVTTHPIEVPVNSTADFFSVFDAITYQKGSSTLKQLAHYVGEENYRRGVSAYLQTHAYGNTELDDFIAYQAQASGMDLGAWTQDWLYSAGSNTLRALPQCEEGQLAALTIIQSTPSGLPTLRRHQVEVALYALDGNGALQAAEVLPVTIAGAETPVKLNGERPCPALINPNHQDWTLAQIELDDRSLEEINTQLENIQEPLARSMFLAALFHRAMKGKIPLSSYLELAMRLAESEENIRMQQQISTSIVATVEMMQRLRPETDFALASLIPALEEQSLRQAATASTGDLKRTWFNTFLAIASTETGLSTLRGLLDGTQHIPGLPLSADLRWKMLISLMRSGQPDADALLAAERATDDSDFGVKNALTADAARPDHAQKAHWLAELQSHETLTGLARQRAVMAGLFPSSQTSLQFTMLDEILASLPMLSHAVDPYFMSSYVQLLLQPMCLPESVAMMQKTLDENAVRLDSTALRFLREAQQADAECLALRSTQGGP
jgi:aminopeptidase N